MALVAECTIGQLAAARRLRRLLQPTRQFDRDRPDPWRACELPRGTGSAWSHCRRGGRIGLSALERAACRRARTRWEIRGSTFGSAPAPRRSCRFCTRRTGRAEARPVPLASSCQDATKLVCMSNCVTSGGGMSPTFSKAGISRWEKNVFQSSVLSHHSITQKPSSVAPTA